MLIYIIPSFYRSRLRKEECIFIFEQAKALSKIEGNKVIVLSVHPISIKHNIFSNLKIKNDLNDNVVTHYKKIILCYHPQKNRKRYVKEFYNALEKMMKLAIKKYGKPDVLYAHFSLYAGFCATKLSKKYNVPLVVEEHFSKFMEKTISKDNRYYLEETINNSNQFICVSKKLRENILNNIHVNKEIKVVSNMIDSSFKYIPLKRSNNFIFFSCGSLIERKGFDLLIKAFGDEFKYDKNVFLRIGGSGIQREKLQEIINQQKNRDNICLIGQLSREQTLIEYSNSNCFVLASRAETFGLVYREALAIGRPIVTTNHGGFSKEDWNNKFGQLIQIDDYDALKKALRKIYNEFDKFDLEEISNLCLSSCSEKKIITTIQNYLEESLK